jgi:hypothetical protein
LCSEINKFIHSIWNREELPQKWKELSTAFKILSNILLLRLTPYVSEVIGDHHVGSVVIDLLRIRFSTFGRYKKKWEHNVTVHQLFPWG